MPSILSVDPYRCRMWALHDRLSAYISVNTCSAEIESFSKYGQLVPVLGRKAHEQVDGDIELIYGARRLFVAQHLHRPLIVELRDISDREAIVAMDIENRQRRDISAYERGRAYVQWLHLGLFSSQSDMAGSLQLSGSQISRLLKLARLPSIVVNAFNSPIDICETWGLDLVEALDCPGKRGATLRRARDICKSHPRPAARDVYQQLRAATIRNRMLKRAVYLETVRDGAGRLLFRITRQSTSIEVLLPTERVSDEMLASIRQALVEVLDSEEVKRNSL